MLLQIWTVFSLVWLVYDCIFAPSNWSNFTTWVWFLQTLFFVLFLWKGHNQFLAVFFLPILFACEFAVAVAIVYLMVQRATIFDQNIEKHGEALTWTGNFFLHYATLFMLIFYMHQSDFFTREVRAYTRIVQQGLGFRYDILLISILFFILYSYISIEYPASHYGTDLSNTTAGLSFLSAGFIGLYTSRLWAGPLPLKGWLL